MNDTVVIDTNVLLVANGTDLKLSKKCQTACVTALRARQQRGRVALDDGHRILREYLNKTHPNQPKGPGDSFLKWLLQNRGNQGRVALVPITEIEPDRFAEFPDLELEARFDPPDRKFAAVANAHDAKPPIWQAADCKWLDWWHALAVKGVDVHFLCPEDACVSYKRKFPGKPDPVLPP
ncbi:MAG: hypothetical protein NFW16_06095 [Candidatus Accumulibacter sp.]|uniref:hypothetical protein n=1 Tax=Accumulibacter sp. TaxID=2053492 RepID=UPI002585DC4D|nr:hypothetical protein [Accumulibacter sp.]MCM8621311.1 hypothetical protein [Accumulibacter sp.]